MRYFSIILVLFLFLVPLRAQDSNSVVTNLNRQLAMFPQEKVYLMTDKAAYVAGEHIWFRAFLTDALSHRQEIPLSRYVYVDLIDPNGEILKHHRIRPDSSGVFHNRIELDYNTSEGTYLLRAYTAYMHATPDYLFEKRVFIAHPQSSAIDVEPEFTITDRRNGSVFFRFRDLSDSSFLPIQNIHFKVGSAEEEEFPAKRPISFRIDPNKKEHLHIAFTHNGKRYAKFVAIPYPNNGEFDVSFYPEGGYLVEGTASKMGFKALRQDGLSEEITGAVYDSQNRLVDSIQSLHAGMGSFYLLPEPEKSYYALCTNKEGVIMRFELPVAQADAYAIRVVQRNGQLVITAQGRRVTADDELFLIVHVRGMALYADKMPNRVALQEDDLPPGIIQILLLDKEMNPLSERLVFNRPKDCAKVEIVPDQANYGKRELVKIDVKLEVLGGDDDSEKGGSFAVSVTDDRDILPDSTLTIASYLLLCSELRGHIENSGYYLSNSQEAKEALDALMLTQGWRRYDIPAVAKGNIEEPENYIEGGQEFSGTVKEFYLLSRPLQGASVWVMAPEIGFIKEVKTDKSGRFYITGFEFPDSTQYVIHARAKNNQRAELFLDPEQSILPAKAFVVKQREEDHRFSNYVAKAELRYMDEYGVKSYDIKEAVVTAKKADAGKSVYSSIMGREVPQFFIDMYPIDIVSILKCMSGVKLVSFDPFTGEIIHGEEYVIIQREAGPALIVWDDVPFEDVPLDFLRGIPIKRVEIQNGITAQIFGQKGMNGAILITTDYEVEAQMRNQHLAKVFPLGYKRAAEFYAPKYETDDLRNNPKSDLRTTIYWKPDVQLIDGASSIDFYTADANSTYSIVLEGITSDGAVIRQTKRIYRVTPTAPPLGQAASAPAWCRFP